MTMLVIADGQESAEQVVGADRGARPTPEKDSEQRGYEHRSHQA